MEWLNHKHVSDAKGVTPPRDCASNVPAVTTGISPPPMWASLEAPKAARAFVRRSPPHAESIASRHTDVDYPPEQSGQRPRPCPMLRDHLHSYIVHHLMRNFDGIEEPVIARVPSWELPYVHLPEFSESGISPVTEKPRNSKSWRSWRGVNSLLTTVAIIVALGARGESG